MEPCSYTSLVSELQKKCDEFNAWKEDLNSTKVSTHLLTRHTQLHWLEDLTRSHRVHDELEQEYLRQLNDGPVLTNNTVANNPPNAGAPPLLPGERAYRLAVTDLFVEKAQAFLEQRAISYQGSGKRAHRLACVIIFAGALFASFQMLTLSHVVPGSWLELTTLFTRAFTAYGMIVLAAVGLWRYGKAMLDQAERLYERRHALRQGRLFIHLNNGRLSIAEMEAAFKWNESQENAFANIHTEASAPWGALGKELFKNFPDYLKSAMQASAGKVKGGEG